MRTRHKKDADYHFAEGELKKLIKHCRSDGFKDDELLQQSADESNPTVAIYLMISIRYGISYNRLARNHFVPYTDADFYAYRKKALAIFRDKLKAEGRYPFDQQ